MDEPRLSSVPEEPDILIQDLEDVAPPIEPQQHAPHRCRRCGEICDEQDVYCADCQTLIHAYPVRRAAWIGALICILVCVTSMFFLGANLLIVRQTLKGDDGMRSGDVQAASDAYLNAYNVSARLNALLFPGRKQTYFTTGSHTLCKQILNLREYNGVFQAGQFAEQYFGDHPPHALDGIMREYRQIAAFVQQMQREMTAYEKSLDGAPGNYDDMVALVDKTSADLPDTPAYMPAYYRFEVSYSLADDPARTARLLGDVEAIAPEELWLYASEGIRAYDLAEEYEKGLALCSRLMALDASNSATIAYTIAQLRLLEKWEDALKVYQKGAAMQTAPSSEMERQRAIVLMLQGKTDLAQTILVESYSPETANLEHVATICVCAFANGDQTVYEEYKAILDGYAPYEQVDLFAAGETTIEEIFMHGGGEIH